jgi:hypothetical protein
LRIRFFLSSYFTAGPIILLKFTVEYTDTSLRALARSLSAIISPSDAATANRGAANIREAATANIRRGERPLPQQ